MYKDAILDGHLKELKVMASEGHESAARSLACVARLQAALKPFGFYYAVNDCQDQKPDDALEVPIADLKAAYNLVGGTP